MRTRLIEYKNKLKEESQQYYEWSSVNENEKERDHEFYISDKLNRIAKDLEEIIY